MAGNPA